MPPFRGMMLSLLMVGYALATGPLVLFLLARRPARPPADWLPTREGTAGRPARGAPARDRLAVTA